MKLITWNIQWGLGIDRKLDLKRIIAHAKAMADFDVLCLQEVSDRFGELDGSSGENQFAELSALLPDYLPIEGIGVDVPHADGGRKRFGNMILSRLPVGRIIRHALPWPGFETPNMPRVLIEAMVETSRGPIRVMTTHLEYSSADLRRVQVQGIRAAHAAATSRVVHRAQATYGPFMPQQESMSAIVTGDFNMPPADASKLLMEEPFEAAIPSFRDAWKVAHGDQAHPPSFCIHDQRYGEPHCCDFIFVTEDLAPAVKRLVYDVETQVSDHQPVLLELS